MSALSGAQAPQRNITGLLLIAMGSVVAAVLVVLAVPYYAGSSARIASLYTNVAGPADRILTADIQAYAVNRLRNRARARAGRADRLKAQAPLHRPLLTFPSPAAPGQHACQLTAPAAQ